MTKHKCALSMTVVAFFRKTAVFCNKTAFRFIIAFETEVASIV